MVVQVLLQLVEVVAGPADPWDGMVRIEGEDELQGFQARPLLLLDGSDSDGPGSYVRGGLAWQRRHRAAGGDARNASARVRRNPQKGVPNADDVGRAWTSRWASWAASTLQSVHSLALIRPAANKALGSAATRAWRARPHCAATSASRRAHHGASQARRTTATGASAERATSAIAGLTRLLWRRALSCRHLRIAVRPPR